MTALGHTDSLVHAGFSSRVYVLGGGNVGLGLAMALEARGARVVGLWNRGAARAAAARQRLKCPVVSGPLPDDVHRADLVFVTVSDRALPAMSERLASARFASGTVLAHASGFLPASVLPAASVARGSMHPLLACPTPDAASRDLPAAFYALEGEARAVAVLKQLADFFGAPSRGITAQAKPRYHAAGVLASNCVVGLLKLASLEARAAGLEELEAPLVHMARGALDKAAQLGVTAALTGPALRGDTDTVRGHVKAMGPVARAAYKPLTRAAVMIARERGLSPALADEIERFVTDEDIPL